MPIAYVIRDGVGSTPWISPDVEAGQVQTGGFTVTPVLRSGERYDFRVTVLNTGNEDAVPWNDNSTTGRFITPASGTGGLAWPLGPATQRTIVTAPNGATRAHLVAAGGYYDLELQNAGGVVLKTLEATISPTDLNRRIGVLYSPDGKYLIVLDFNAVSKNVTISAYAAQAAGALALGQQIIGSNANAQSYQAYLFYLNLTSQWSGDNYAGLNFTFDPTGKSLFLHWQSSTNQTQYAILDLGERPFRTTRRSIDGLQRSEVGRHLFSPGGELFAWLPAQLTSTIPIELYELPSGDKFAITLNGYGNGQLLYSSPPPSMVDLEVESPTAYGGIVLTGINNSISNQNAIDPPFRARCAAQVHFWVATPAGSLDERNSGNIKMPANVSIQGASAYLARVGRGLSASTIIVAQYLAPRLNPSDHRCLIAEAYSVRDAIPFEGKIRTGSAFTPLVVSQVAQTNVLIIPPNSPYFVAPYLVANHGENPLHVHLKIKRLGARQIAKTFPFHKRLKAQQMEVQSTGFIEYPCGVLRGRDQVESQQKLSMTLMPGDQVSLALVVDVAIEPDPNKFEWAGFHIVEKRSDGTHGGVTVIAVSNLDFIPPVTDVEPPDACPIDLVTNPYWCESPYSPPQVQQTVIPGHSSGYLAAEIVNRSTDTIDDLELWIESHAIPETRIEPLVFQSLHLEPGEKLFAAWPIETGSFLYGHYPVSIVCQSPKHSPHRLITTVIANERGG